jgi:DNA-cytosine methyltransferase
MTGLNILSLFDGISAGKVAIERAGIPIAKYYSSEIDKYAIQVSKANHPDIIQLGDATKWKGWDIDWASIDLLFAGFPCQSWSVAGKQLGDKDARGQLMWVMLDILNHIKSLNTNVKFLFENVRMKKEFLVYVNKAIGVDPIMIDSALVSAQSRQRLYWTNIEGDDNSDLFSKKRISQPEDRGILLKDIVGDDVSEKYHVPRQPPCRNLIVSENKTTVKVRKYEVEVERLRMVLMASKLCKEYTCNDISRKLKVPKTKVEHWFRRDDSFAIPDAEVWPRLKSLLEIETDDFDKSLTEFEIKYNTYDMANRVYHTDGKAPTLTTGKPRRIGHYNGGGIGDRVYSTQAKSVCLRALGGGRGAKTGLYAVAQRGRNIVDGKRKDIKGAETKQRFETSYNEKANALTGVQKDSLLLDRCIIRKLTPNECCRLQTLPDNYCSVVSDSQAYKCLGNTWTVDVIVHILKNIINKKNKNEKKTN